MSKGLLAGLVAAVVIVGIGIGVLVLKKPETVKDVEKIEVVDKSGRTTTEVKVTEKVSVTKRAAVKGKIEVVNVIPADSLLFISAVDIKGTWDTLKTSDFWKQVIGLPVWQTANVGPSIGLLAQQASANLGIELNEENIMGLFGQNVGIALVSGGAAGAMNPSLVIAAKLDESAGMEAKIKTMLDKLQGPLTITDSEYNGVSVTRVVNPTTPGPQFNYAFIADLFIIGAGLDDSVIKQVIDLSLSKGKGSLGKSDKYAEAMDKVKVSGEIRSLLFVDVTKIVDLVRAFPIPGIDEAGVTEGIERTLGVIKTIAGALSFNYSGKTVDRVDYNMFFAKSDTVTDSDILEAWNIKPADLKNLSFVPSGSILFSMSNTVDIGKLWELWKNSLRQQSPERADEIFSTIDKFESDTGVSIQDDIIAWIGDEFGFLLSDIDMGVCSRFRKLPWSSRLLTEQKQQLL